MNNVPLMHESDAIRNLPHESNAVKFSQRKVIRHDALKELTTINPANSTKRRTNVYREFKSRAQDPEVRTGVAYYFSVRMQISLSFSKASMI